MSPQAPTARRRGLRSGVVYTLMVGLGAVAFTWPFLVPADALPRQGHTATGPLLAAALTGLVVLAVGLETRERGLSGASVALLGVLAAAAGLLRLLNLPGGGNGIFFLVVLAGAALGPRFGLLLGMLAMAVSSVLIGGIGPWLPFQMLTLGWMGGSAGLLGRLTRRLATPAEVGVLAAHGWLWGFVFGVVMNLWFWPFIVDGGALSYAPGAGVAANLARYWGFYLVTSFAWDAAAATSNAVLIAVTGAALLATLRRFADRLEPEVALDPL